MDRAARIMLTEIHRFLQGGTKLDRVVLPSTARRPSAPSSASCAAGSGRAPAWPPAVVLVRPREEGNVGSAARAMANMGLERLILVEPAAEIGKVGTAFAVGAQHVLDEDRARPRSPRRRWPPSAG